MLGERVLQGFFGGVERQIANVESSIHRSGFSQSRLCKRCPSEAMVHPTPSLDEPRSERRSRRTTPRSHVTDPKLQLPTQQSRLPKCLERSRRVESYHAAAGCAMTPTRNCAQARYQRLRWLTESRVPSVRHNRSQRCSVAGSRSPRCSRRRLALRRSSPLRWARRSRRASLGTTSCR